MKVGFGRLLRVFIEAGQQQVRFGCWREGEQLLPGFFRLVQAAELPLTKGDAPRGLRQSGRSLHGIGLNLPSGFAAKIAVASALPVALVFVKGAAKGAGLSVVGQSSRRVKYRDG